MFLNRVSWVKVGALALLAVALLAAATGYGAGRLRAAPSATPALRVTVLNASCTGANILTGGTYIKIGDIGTFEVQSGDSLVEVTFFGRLYASATNGTGVRYELRVDDAASTTGRIRAVVRVSELGEGVGRSMGGFFEGLAPGTHMVSMWAQVANGSTASNVMFDPGCWSSDHVVVKEYLPFGSIALPAVLGE